MKKSQEHVHKAQAASARDDFVTGEGVEFEEFLLGFVELVVSWAVEKVVGSEKKVACGAGWIDDGLVWLGVDAAYHCANQRSRGEVLARARFFVFGVFS